MDKTNLWKVPAYCMASGFLCYLLLVRVGLGRLALVTLPDGANAPEQELLRRERQARVRAAIEAMSPVDREIFLRYYYYLQPAPEIAQAMGLTHGAVRTRLSRGRAALKKILLQEDAVWT